MVIDEDPVPIGPGIQPTPSPSPSPVPGGEEDPVVIEEDPIPLGPDQPAEPTPAPSVQPEASPSPTPDVIGLPDDELPLGGPELEQLPKTGESSPLPFYAAGLALAGLGLFLRTRLSRKNK